MSKRITGNINVSALSSGTINITNSTTTNLLSTNITSSILINTDRIIGIGNSNTIGNIFTTGGNVGIGTINPSGRLHLFNNTTGCHLLLTGFANNTASNTGIFFSNDDNASLGTSRFKSKILAVGNGFWGQSDLHFCLNNQNDMNDAGLSDTRMVITKAGNIGINSTSPSSRLTVSDTGATRGILKLVTSTNNAEDNWWIGFGHGNNTNDSNDRARIGVKIESGGPGRLFFTTGGAGNQTERITIDGSGNVGVGTTAPSSKLHVFGIANAFILDGSSNIVYSDYKSTVAGVSGRLLMGIDGTGFGNFENGASLIGSWTNTPLIFATNGAQRMRISTAGNLGVGITNPSTTIHGSGNLRMQGAQAIQIDPNNVQLQFGTPENPSNYMIIGAYSGLNNIDTTNRSFHIFSSTNSLLFANPNGNVGIGTNSPTSKLHVVGNVNATGDIYANTISSGKFQVYQFPKPGYETYTKLRLTGGNNSGYIYPLWISDSATDGIGISYAYDGNNWNNSLSSMLELRYGNIEMKAWNMYFTGTAIFGGNVGIGTGAPGYRLDVQGGDINASGSVRSAGAALTSDQRVKENIVDADTSVNLDHILALAVKQYDYTQAFLEHTKRQDESNYGFIAQQVKEVIPNAVDIQSITLYRDEQITTTNTDSDGNETSVIITERVVAQEIPDFHFLKKDLIFTEAVGAIQEVYKQLQATKTELALEQESHNETKTELNNIKQFLQSKFPGEMP